MANLIYAEYNAGCSVFWNLSNDVPTDYHYGMSASRSCYYADLEPNTTYTIQAVDSTDVFRIALTSQDLKYLHATSDTVVSNPFSWGYRADNSTPVTFTTGSNNIHLVAIYTTTSQYNIRVMLNEGSTIEPYTAPTRYFKDHWRLINGELVYSGMPEPLDYLTPPYPASMWYLDEENKLMNGLLPEPPAEGSFMDCTTLEYVSIPESVQYIGKYAFAHTSLTRVRISRTCTYYPTSFPPGCEIWFYGDEMEPADDFYSKAEIDAMMIRLGILGLELFKISDLETRKISILEGD